MKDTTVFDDTKLSDLLKNIHSTTLEKRIAIDSVIRTLIPMIKNADDAIMLAPIVREFYDVSVRNDDHLLKIATIVQRVISAESYADGGDNLDNILSDTEKAQLLKTAMEDLENDVVETDKELGVALTKVKSNG